MSPTAAAAADSPHTNNMGHLYRLPTRTCKLEDQQHTFYCGWTDTQQVAESHVPDILALTADNYCKTSIRERPATGLWRLFTDTGIITSESGDRLNLLKHCTRHAYHSLPSPSQAEPVRLTWATVSYHMDFFFDNAKRLEHILYIFTTNFTRIVIQLYV